MSAPTVDGEQVLYRFWTADGELLYVGITNDPGRRWREHSGDKPWWHEVATITVERFASREAVEVAERLAIVTEGPTYNVVHGAAGAAHWATVERTCRAVWFSDVIASRSARRTWSRRHRRASVGVGACLMTIAVALLVILELPAFAPDSRVPSALAPYGVGVVYGSFAVYLALRGRLIRYGRMVATL